MKAEYRMMVLFAVAGMVLWVASALIDYVYVPLESFAQVLAADVLLIVCFVVFGLLMAKALARERQVANLLRAFRDNIPDSAYVKDREHRFVIVTQAKADHWQTTVEDMIGKTDHDFFIGAQADAAQADEQRVMETGEPIVGQTECITHPDGSKHWYLVSKAPHRDVDGQIIGVLGISRDITELHRAQREAARVAQQWQTTFDAIEDMVVIIDRDYHVVRANRAAENGFPGTEVVGTRCYELFHGRQDRPPNCPSCGVFDTGEAVSVEICDQHLGGRWFELGAYPVPTPDGTIEQAVHVWRDITERKQAEQQLAVEHQQLDMTLRSIGDGVIATDGQGRVMLINSVAEEMTGWLESEALGRSVSEIFMIVNQHTREPVVNPVERVLASDGLVGLANDTVLISRDGTERIIADSGAPIRTDGEITGVVLVFRDITERTRWEEARRESQKMEAVGTLAMGVAHDFNNILQALMGRAQLMLHSRDFDAETTEDLQEMVHAGERGASLVRRLLTFSRQVEPVKQVVQLGGPIDDVGAILERTISKLIEINIRVADDLWPIEADPHHIEQVLLNLSINASEAMPQGGTLELSAENATLEEPDEEIAAGRYVVVTISDTGIGMAEDALQHIFEPFYTAKGRAEHSGLGLAVVHGIIESHGGFIRVSSKPGAGTTFRIHLPAAGAEAEGVSAPEAGEEESFVLRRPATVLVVDDEPAVARLACDILEHGGHSSLKAMDGEEGVELFSTHHEEIDLVILDLVMPKMDGEECLQRLQEIAPDIPVIITTGYVIDETMHERLQRQVQGFADKPFTVAGLLSVVQEALRGD